MTDLKKSATVVVDATSSGMRLDGFLSILCPGLGLRGRRRLIDRNLVLVDERRRPAGWFLSEGETVCLLEENAAPARRASVVEVTEDYCFFQKPAGLHSVALAGTSTPSLEAQAGVLAAEHGVDQVMLLQRLDFMTSGIVAAARTAEAEKAFRDWEREGKVEKAYVCVLCGNLESQTTVRARLVSDGARGVRVLPDDDPDPQRTTSFTPIVMGTASSLGLLTKSGRDETLTVAGCVIRRGARHQIRAHAASLGHPLLGDILYGGSPLQEWEGLDMTLDFFLHHARLAMPCHGLSVLPSWKLEDEVMQRVVNWVHR